MGLSTMVCEAGESMLVLVITDTVLSLEPESGFIFIALYMYTELPLCTQAFVTPFPEKQDSTEICVLQDYGLRQPQPKQCETN